MRKLKVIKNLRLIKKINKQKKKLCLKKQKIR